ncbi:MAG: RNA-directed DNA polymerase [Methylophilaceae bacterium]
MITIIYFFIFISETDFNQVELIMIKIKELLSHGVMPSQLPPCFSSTSFGKKHNVITKQITLLPELTSKKCAAIRPELFSVARIGHSRRLTSIVNPITQYYLSRVIAQNWKSLQKHYAKSSLSLSKPEIVEGGSRSIAFTPIRELQEKKVIDSAGYKYALISDISQFFPTIYTHTIGWALDGKEIAKPKQYAKNLHLNDLGILLDKRVGHCQSSQTIGVPVGPDTSHILAEIIGVAIDLELEKKLTQKPAGFRFVDDYYLFFHTKDAAEDALAKLSNSMSYFELKINSVKTKIIPIDDLSEETWKYSLQQFKFESSRKKQKNSINHYFDLAFRMAKLHLDENVMVYAIKRLKGEIVKKKNWKLFEAYLCKVLLMYPNTIQDISHLLITYKLYDYIEDKSPLARTLNQLILGHALLEHHSEIAWALWLSRELKIKLEHGACVAVNNISSSVCLILAYDLQLNGLLETNIDQTKFQNFLDPKELWRTNWLLAYEAGIRDWMGTTKASILADPYFGVLAKYGVNFYDNKMTLQPIFSPKTILPDLDSDELINDEFFFLEETDDYTGLEVTLLDELIEELDEPVEHTTFEDFEDDIPF